MELPEISPVAPIVFYLAGLPVSATIIAAWLACLVLIVFAFAATRNMQLIPSGVQNVAEAIVEALLSLCEQVAGPRGRAYLPLVATLFLFIVTANWMGVLPFYGESNWIPEHVPWTASHEPPLRSANSDLNITVVMAVLVAVWVQITRIRASGLGGWLKHLTWGPPPILELISELSRPMSLALRLFGNIFAGGVLVFVMTNLAPPIVPALFMGFELFVGLVQGLIFAMLTLAFLSLAATHADGGDEHHGAAH